MAGAGLRWRRVLTGSARRRTAVSFAPGASFRHSASPRGPSPGGERKDGDLRGRYRRLQPAAALRDGLLSGLAAPSCREGNRLISARLMAACRVADVTFAPN